MIAKYGQQFGSQYGWAADARTKKPTFKDLQKAADCAGMNSYYKLASVNVHATSRSMFFRLAAMSNPDLLLAGRSNAGLVEPGQNTAFTLVAITGTLIGSLTNMDRLIEMKALTQIRDAIPAALQRADRKLRQDERAFNASRSKRLRRLYVKRPSNTEPLA